jgi:hypothetical protein
VLPVSLSAINSTEKPIHILVITGNHSYQVDSFNQMLSGLGDNIT